MRVIRFGALAASPWKNGGGSTVEIAVHPEGAGIDDFEWRVSVADVRSDGPFSRFEGVDRILTLLSGGPLWLDFPDHAVRLEACTPPFAFAGETAVTGRLGAGPARDLNVMTRRSVWRASVHRRAIAPGGRCIGPGAARFAFAAAPCTVNLGGTAFDLDAFDALALDPREPAPVVAGAKPAHIVSIALRRR